MPEPITLLVEDEPLVLLVAQDALEAGGFTVIPVQLASQAISILDSKSAELSGLVTDIPLPAGPNGWEIASCTRTPNGPSCRVYNGGQRNRMARPRCAEQRVCSEA